MRKFFVAAIRDRGVEGLHISQGLEKPLGWKRGMSYDLRPKKGELNGPGKKQNQAVSGDGQENHAPRMRRKPNVQLRLPSGLSSKSVVTREL